MEHASQQAGLRGRLAVTVSILFITPTTVYDVAETKLWHQKPAHEMHIPDAIVRRGRLRGCTGAGARAAFRPHQSRTTQAARRERRWSDGLTGA